MRRDVFKTQKQIFFFCGVASTIVCVCTVRVYSVCVFGGGKGRGVFLSTFARYSLNLSSSRFMTRELVLLH